MGNILHPRVPYRACLCHPGLTNEALHLVAVLKLYGADAQWCRHLHNRPDSITTGEFLMRI